MKPLWSVLVFFLLFFVSTKNAHAIVVIVPTLLVSVVKIVALIISAISVPVVGLSTLYFKVKKKSSFAGVLLGVAILILISLLLVALIKFFNPQRPIY